MRIAGSAAYLQERARGRGGRALFLMVAGVLLPVMGFVAAQSPGSTALGSALPAFLGFGALLFGVQLAGRARRDAEAVTIEGPVITQLRARLSDDYLYLRRVSLPGMSAEADGVLLGPHGALVIGIYPATGRFTVNGDDWTAAPDRLLRESPSWALTRRLRTLQRLVREEGLSEVAVQGAVVLTHGELAGAEKPSVAVVPVNKIASYVEYLRPADPESVREDVQKLAELLMSRAAGGRAVSETPPLSPR